MALIGAKLLNIPLQRPECIFSYADTMYSLNIVQMCLYLVKFVFLHKGIK